MSLELKNSKCRATIYPEYGGMLNHFLVKKKETEIDVIYGYDSEQDIKANIGVDFRNVKLTPYPNRIKGGKYVFCEQEHALAINFPNENNSIHGLLFDQPYEVITQSDDVLILRYTVSKDKYQGYPFSYTIEMAYALLETGLACTTTILNTDSKTIPIADGFHPYFRLGNSVEDVKLKLPNVTQLLLEDGIPSMERKNYKPFSKNELIGQTFLDDCFEITDQDNAAETVLEKGDISISIKQDTGQSKYNFLQVYTPPSRKCIAIEPMTSAPNCFNNKLGLIQLEAGKKIKLSYQFTVAVKQ